MAFEVLSQLLGGLAMFLLGIEMVSGGLRRAAGPGLHHLMERMTADRFLGLLAGVLLSFGMQSSSAATVMLVGLVDVGLLSLLRALPVALGSAIGTTFTVQAIAFDVQHSALLLLAVGLGVRYACTYDRHKRIGDALFGLGLLFYGMVVMKNGATPLAGETWFQHLLVRFAESPLLGVAVSALLTGIIQSSAATIAVVISIAVTRVTALPTPEETTLMLRLAVPLILGANVGTCVTALIASLTASRPGKQVAVGNLLFKMGGVLLCLPFVRGLADVSGWATHAFIPADEPAAAARAIANAHTFFNVAAALVFLPFIKAFERLVRAVVPERGGRRRTRFLAPGLLEMPEVALYAVAAEVGRVAAQVRDMYALTRAAILEDDLGAADRVPREDAELDKVLAEITDFAIGLSAQKLGSDAARRRDALLITLRNLENIGDVLNRDMIRLARKLIERGLRFSDEGRRDLGAMFDEVGHSLDRTLVVLAGRDAAAAHEVLAYEETIEARRRELFGLHLERLSRNDPLTARTAEVHMDVITGLRQVHSLLAESVQELLGLPERPPAPDAPGAP